MIDNALVEHANHDIAQITLNYRLLLAALLKCMPVQQQSGVQPSLGTRQCADIHTTALLTNASVNIDSLFLHCPATTRTSTNSLMMQIGKASRHLPSTCDGLSLLKFSIREQQKLEHNEATHKRYNEQIDERIEIDEEMEETWSVDRSKVYIFTDGRMVMTGATNRRSVITAYSIVLQVLDHFQCVQSLL